MEFKRDLDIFELTCRLSPEKETKYKYCQQNGKGVGKVEEPITYYIRGSIRTPAAMLQW